MSKYSKRIKESSKKQAGFYQAPDRSSSPVGLDRLDQNLEFLQEYVEKLSAMVLKKDVYNMDPKEVDKARLMASNISHYADNVVSNLEDKDFGDMPAESAAQRMQEFVNKEEDARKSKAYWLLKNHLNKISSAKSAGIIDSIKDTWNSATKPAGYNPNSAGAPAGVGEVVDPSGTPTAEMDKDDLEVDELQENYKGEGDAVNINGVNYVLGQLIEEDHEGAMWEVKDNPDLVITFDGMEYSVNNAS